MPALSLPTFLATVFFPSVRRVQLQAQRGGGRTKCGLADLALLIIILSFTMSEGLGTNAVFGAGPS